MQRLCVVLAATVGVAIASSPTPAKALMVAPAPASERFMLADVVFIGKVVSIENKSIEAPQFPGSKDKVAYQVAVVKITDPITGAKGLTSVRVGFVPPVNAPVPPNDGPIRRPIRRFPQVNLTVDMEAVFMLKQHHEETFYIAPMYADVLGKKDNPNFDKEVEKLKRYSKLIADPMASLKGKDAEDRLTTASLLLTRYRTAPMGVENPKMEPVAAEESKLILEALAGADWNPKDGNAINVQQTFFRLGLTDKDGWKPAPFKNYAVEFPAAAKKWLTDNAATYRVQKFVAEKPAK